LFLQGILKLNLQLKLLKVSKGEVVLVHSMKAYDRVEAKLHAFVILV